MNRYLEQSERAYSWAIAQYKKMMDLKEELTGKAEFSIIQDSVVIEVPPEHRQEVIGRLKEEGLW
jgi:hypothetical protein